VTVKRRTGQIRCPRRHRHLTFGLAVGEACFQPDDQRPQFANGISGTTALARDLGQPDGGISELEHRPEVGVAGTSDSKDVRGD
jgi:hypothetical protein